MSKGPIRGPDNASRECDALPKTCDFSAAVTPCCSANSAEAARDDARHMSEREKGTAGAVPFTLTPARLLEEFQADYCSSFKIVCGTAFAWASMAVPACKRIWFLVKLTISRDMSVSAICDSDAVRFWLLTCRFEIVDMKRFWTAPNAPRLLETSATAPSINCWALA